jgi:transposase
MKYEKIVGLDLGDKFSYACVLDATTGEVIKEKRIATRASCLQTFFAGRPAMQIAIETGTHSPWVSRLLESFGHEVLVANARKVRLVYGGARKSDKLDAQRLARLARLDPKLLSPIQHRCKDAQAHLALIRSRDALVSSRVGLVNHVRGSVKAFGARLPVCSTRTFARKARAVVPEELLAALEPVLAIIEKLSEQILAMEKRIKVLGREAYPETNVLRQVTGVGAITALTFILTLEDPTRFKKSRDVGAFLGLTPGQRQSGDRDVKLRISKRGDEGLRRLLVQSAHFLLGPFEGDCDLRRHGEKIEASGGGYAKQRAIVAVARKLAVLLHRLWLTQEIYEPLRNSDKTLAKVA